MEARISFACTAFTRASFIHPRPFPFRKLTPLLLHDCSSFSSLPIEALPFSMFSIVFRRQIFRLHSL